MTKLTRSRPAINHTDVTSRYVTALLPRIQKWAEDMAMTMAADECVLEDLSEAVVKSDDGFERALYLKEECGWLPNAALVNLLSNSNSIRRTAHQDAQKEWAFEQGIRFPAKEGDAVSFSVVGRGGLTTGKVMAVFEGMAYALVSVQVKVDPKLPHEIREVGAESITHVRTEDKGPMQGVESAILPFVGFQVVK